MPSLSSSSLARWLVVAPALVLPMGASLCYFVLFAGSDFGNGFYKAIKAFMLVWPAAATWLILRETFRREPPGVIGRRRSLLRGALFGVAVAALLLLLREYTPMGEVLQNNGDRIRGRVDGLGMLDHFILASIAISTAHAALEEYYWRWFVYGNLRHLLPPAWAHGLAAAGFMANHVVVTSQFFPIGFAFFLGICVAAGGAYWSWLYQRHRTLLGPWLSHMIVDFAIFYVGYRLLFAG